MITKIVTVLVSVYKSFCNTVCIYGHANKASAAFELKAFKAAMKDVFSRSYCCYGNL